MSKDKDSSGAPKKAFDYLASCAQIIGTVIGIIALIVSFIALVWAISNPNAAIRIVQVISGQPTSTPVVIMLPSDTPLPTYTYSPPPTQTPLPTDTPIPTPTTRQNTAPGSILRSGEIWEQNGMEIRLKNPSFVPGCNGLLGFELIITNNSNGDLLVNISGEDFEITDNVGRSYPEVWYNPGSANENCYSHKLKNLQIPAMKSGERIDLALRVLGNPSQTAIQIILIIHKAGRIEEAKWSIDIPR